mmetsp:Transcript_90387/g.179867  ORF Transcript_90387/g.179867 Transcript_90387/m.179867 type:complete len:449 (+) Transcript_90387:93-1439(+)|eukprot:CAMPEP_0172661804 /NCGR_PEP_ID=MMETSP1074-20121228/4953_1 /TAXON_ID=2916 /ORGANISM="Ceratium fusus, Strain PA161109" /LENGTH=448 /DNA_ID=CAMNT_0013477631 /DNA_START=66 /DNA_END=1412 /DNA_ORIENTATION=+
MTQAEQSMEGDQLSAFVETLALASFRQREVSVTLGQPRDPDCPLIGVSDGFERLTGYPREEIVGKNCRFLNQGCVVSAVDRHAMRVCLRTGQSFTGVLQNRRKNGELFSNLLTMRTLRIGTMPYIIGVQIDVTNIEVDLASKKIAAELTALIDAIFSANVEAWAKHHAADWITQQSHSSIRRPLYPLAGVLDVASKQPETYAQARNAFVSMEASLDQNILQISNTFWEPYDIHCDPKAKQTELRKVMSEPSLRTGAWKRLLDQSPRAQHAHTVDSLELFYSSMAARPLVPLSRLTLCKEGSQATGQLAPLNIPTPSTEESWATRPLVPLNVLAPSVEESQDSIAEKVPEEMGSLASIGSTDHPVACTPCSFFCYSPMGCDRGSACTFCHMSHPRRTRRRGHKKRNAGKKEGDDENKNTGEKEGDDEISLKFALRKYQVPQLDSIGEEA